MLPLPLLRLLDACKRRDLDPVEFSIMRFVQPFILYYAKIDIVARFISSFRSIANCLGFIVMEILCQEIIVLRY